MVAGVTWSIADTMGVRASATERDACPRKRGCARSRLETGRGRAGVSLRSHRQDRSHRAGASRTTGRRPASQGGRRGASPGRRGLHHLGRGVGRQPTCEPRPTRPGLNNLRHSVTPSPRALLEAHRIDTVAFGARFSRWRQSTRRAAPVARGWARITAEGVPVKGSTASKICSAGRCRGGRVPSSPIGRYGRDRHGDEG